jgi:hypothetical protein
MLLHIPKLVAERGLCQMQTRPRAGDAAFIGNGGDQFQMTDF